MKLYFLVRILKTTDKEEDKFSILEIANSIHRLKDLQAAYVRQFVDDHGPTKISHDGDNILLRYKDGEEKEAGFIIVSGEKERFFD